MTTRADAFLMDIPEAFGHFGLGGAGGWANPAVYESLGIYKGVCHTLRHGPIVDLVPKR